MKTKAIPGIAMPMLLLLVLTSCENSYWNCLRGNGVQEQETRVLEEFDGVVTEGEYEVFYVPDTGYSVIIRTDENLIPYIRTRLTGSTLVVDNGTRKCLRSEYPIQVYVHCPEIRLMSLVGSGFISADAVVGSRLELSIEGSGFIDVIGINVLELKTVITGSGEAILEGEASKAEYIIAGSGDIDAKNVLTDHCLADISGSGSIYCNAVARLDAYISGSGNIYYRGSPTVSSTISGSGTIQSIP